MTNESLSETGQNKAGPGKVHYKAVAQPGCRLTHDDTTGCSAAWQRACFGSRRSRVQIPAARRLGDHGVFGLPRGAPFAKVSTPCQVDQKMFIDLAIVSG
jgi:hypothetical protein